MPNRKFAIIYADPPWHYRDKANAGKRGASHKYPVMTDAEVASLTVQDITQENCVLFLWATMPKLPVAMQVISRWGFQYKTVAFNWVKTNRKNPEKDFFGMGHWTRSNSELCLLAVKGKIRRECASVRQVLRRPILSHSEKPPEVRERIVQLMGDLPRIELFARERVQGWCAWGNEVRKDVHLEYSLTQPDLSL
jgi:N6-adenosine-specific RNA methylase IME4